MSPATVQKLIFATRTTLAALLAAWVAFYVHLPQASTSMITVFIVSQPLAGMVLSKSLYRVIGTLTGAVVAVVLTDWLSQEPELFAAAISLWIGACVTASVYLRDAPASYGALLSGYSVAIIAFPAVGAPDTIFQAALDRGSEICVGIGCAAALSQIFFPQSAAGSLARATREAVSSASRWAAETLTGRPDAATVLRDRRALVASVSRLENLRVHASFDSAAIRLSNRRIRLLHARLVSLLALLVSLHDRLEILRAESPDRAEALKPLLDRAADAMSLEADPATREAARSALVAALPDLPAMRRDRTLVFERTLLLRTADLVEIRGDVALLELAGPSSFESDERVDASLARYRDHGLALVSGAIAFATQLAICAFWIASGWNAGSGAAIMVAVMASLFAQLDDPARAAGSFFAMTVVGSVAAAAYAFAILPGLEGFETLAVALAPFLFTVAFAMTYPAYALPALACALGALNAIGLTNVMTPDFASFSNGALAQLVGIGLAAVLLGVLRPIGAAWPLARLQAGLKSDLAEAVAGRERGRIAFESRMFDRIDGLMTRLDLSDPDQLAIEQGALASLRVGLNALALRHVVRDLPEGVSGPVADALADLARHFRRLARGQASTPPLEKLDAALEASLSADLSGLPEAADLPVWISSVRTSMARHPRLFGEAPERADEIELRAAA